MRDAPDADVVVVGAGMAGLAAADLLSQAGLATMVIEARDRPGGRIRAESGLQVGGEFIGRPHLRARALIDRLGLETRSMPRSGPILWRTPSRSRLGRVPPVPASEAAAAARTLRRMRRDAKALDPEKPWNSPATTELDAVSVTDYLSSAGPAAHQVLGALIEGFGTARTGELSALQLTWWIGRAGGLAAALASGTGAQLTAGAHTLPARYADALTDALAAPIRYRTALTAIEHPHNGDGRGDPAAHVRLTTSAGELRAKAAVLAVPLPALRQIPITPPLPGTIATAVTDLSFGTATKISALIEPEQRIRPRAAIGGSPLQIAWRTGSVVSGISAEPGHHHDRLLTDLRGIFGIAPDAVRASASRDWSSDSWTGGSYIAFAPGQLTRHGAALRRPVGRLAFAAAERSSWPNSIEGALESGHAAAAHIRTLLQSL